MHFIARRLELIERSEEEKQAAKLAKVEEKVELKKGVSVHSDETEKEWAKAIRANLAITGLKKKFSS